MTHPLIIIGAGLAGWSTVREFRKLDTTTPVMVITADAGDFYAKPSLSNAFAQGRSPAQLVSTPAAKMVAAQNVTLQARTRVLRVVPETRTVITTQGEFRYRALVLATGAQPIRIPVDGDAADQVRSINSLDDFAAFHAHLTAGAAADDPATPKHVLIMGAGLIGCEFANDLVSAGYAVSVADPCAGPMAALLPAQASAELGQALAGLGVQWHFGHTVKSVNQVAGTSVPALQVTLSNGQSVPADAVLSAVGLRADTSLAQAAGLACERGVLVDATLQTSQPDIYALGDSAQYASGRWHDTTSVTGGRTMPYVMPIMSAARALAATLAGTPSPVVFPLMPVAIKTPAFPIVVAAPAPGAAGDWQLAEPGVWQFIDPQGQHRGFVLAGSSTGRRAEQAKLVAA